MRSRATERNLKIVYLSLGCVTILTILGFCFRRIALFLEGAFSEHQEFSGMSRLGRWAAVPKYPCSDSLEENARLTSGHYYLY